MTERSNSHGQIRDGFTAVDSAELARLRNPDPADTLRAAAAIVRDLGWSSWAADLEGEADHLAANVLAAGGETEAGAERRG